MLLAFWRSTIGKKIVMAVTGVIMIAFLIGHVLGNLLVFKGPEAMNSYGHFLHTFGHGGALWVVRVVLLVSVVLHIIAVVQLTRTDWAARQHGYRKKVPQAATLASRTMRWGGVLILAFIIFHLLHLTTGTIQPVAFAAGDPYHNMTGGFRIWWVALIYIIAMIAIGLHLYHGGWAFVRTLGLTRPGNEPLQHRWAAVVAVLIWLGFTIIPVAILAGLVG